MWSCLSVAGGGHRWGWCVAGGSVQRGGAGGGGEVRSSWVWAGPGCCWSAGERGGYKAADVGVPWPWVGGACRAWV